MLQNDGGVVDLRTPGPSGLTPPRPRWYLLYYLLAALDVVTVLARRGCASR